MLKWFFIITILLICGFECKAATSAFADSIAMLSHSKKPLAIIPLTKSQLINDTATFLHDTNAFFADTSDHIVETNTRITECSDHIAETYSHITESYNRIVDTNSHITESYDHIVDTTALNVDSAAISPSLSSPKPKKRLFFLRLLDKALSVDTNYIERNKYNLTFMTRSDWRYKMIWLRGKDDTDNSHQTLYFHPKSQVTIGPYVGYSLLFLGWTIDIGSNLSSNNTNLYLSLYAPMFGVDYYYERDVNGYKIARISGFSKEVKEASRDQDFPGLSTHMKYLHFYYIFNHRHFSYPAAYSQSTIQRRSSGALILGYTYSLQKIDFNYEQLPSAFYDANGDLIINNALRVHEVKYHNHSISLGYTYNWVFARNFLFNISTSPAIGYNFTRGEDLTSEKIYRLSNINFDFIGKLAIVWNTNRLFAGGSFTAHTYAYRKSTFSCQNILLGAQLYFGINLWAKKAYRKHKSKRNN